ncbi:hypothetical protein D3C77_777970 [compost metagenome]
MYNAAKMRPVFLLDRNDIPIIAKCNNGILQHLLNRGGANHLLELLANTGFAIAKLPSDGG